MKKNIVFILVLVGILVASCDDVCKEKIYNSVILVDVSDERIINQFNKEVPILLEEVAPPLQRCEGVEISISGIGQKIETPAKSIRYPAEGVLNNTLGDYAILDSNKALKRFFIKEIDGSIGMLRSDAGDSSSQIFYAIGSALQKNPNSRIILYSDLVENFGALNFYKKIPSFKDALHALLSQYAIDSTSKPVFMGQLTIVSSLADQQKNVLEARRFFNEYFSWLGITSNHFEFISTISETKFKTEKL